MQNISAVGALTHMLMRALPASKYVLWVSAPPQSVAPT